MARKQATSITEIADAALEQITRHGFRRTQMADVAKAIGVSAGTLYLYVENKEALLALASLHLLGENLENAALPFKEKSRQSLVELFIEKASLWARWPRLERAIQEKDVSRETLEEVGVEIYDLIARHKRAILLLDRLASELPEVAPVHTENARGRLNAFLVDLVQSTGTVTLDRDAISAIARMANEVLSWSAMHRHRPGFDAQPMGSLTEGDVRTLASRAFAATLSAALDPRPVES